MGFVSKVKKSVKSAVKTVAPFVVAAMAGPAAGGWLATTGWAAGVLTTGAAYATTYAVGAAITRAVVGTLVAGALGGGSQPSSVGVEQARGMLINAASSIDPLRVIYGSRRVGGTYVIPPTSSGSSNEYLHLVIALCEGEISAINEVYLDDVPTTDARYSGLVTVEKFLGTDTQAASALLIEAMPGKWTSAHQGKGVAYLHIRIKYSQNAFSGLPTVTADIDGKKVYDPADTLTKFSNNPALCLRDYLTNTRYGRGIGSAMLADSTFISAASHCAASVAIPGGAQARYTCDGVVNIDDTVYANTQRLLTSCRGMLIFSGGKYKLIIDKAETPVAFTFSEDNITGAWEFHRPGKSDKANKVTASFFNPANSWQPDFAIQDSTSYRAQDNGLLLERKIDLPYTSNAYRAGHLAQLEMKSTRFATTVMFSAFQEGLRCDVGDVVTITHSTPGWTAKPFRIMTIDILDSDDVKIVAREYDDEAYTLDDLAALGTAPTTNLPDPFTCGMPGNLQVAETLYETTGSAGVKARITLTWDAPADAFVMNYEVEYKLRSSSTWLEVFDIRGTIYLLDDIKPGVYDFRVKARNVMGAVSDYTPTTFFTLYGLTAAPADVSNFSVKVMNGMALATWNRTTDLDVKIGGDVVIRWCPEAQIDATWEASIILPDGELNGDATSALLPLITGTYFAKFIDSTGHYSATAASFPVTEALITGWSTVATSTQHTAFAGNKDGVVVMDDVLKLDSAETIEQQTELMSTWGLISTIGGVDSAGTYDFDATMDLSTVATRRFHAHIKALSYDTGDTIGQRGLVSTWQSVSGDAVNDCDATVFASVSDDDIIYGEWTPFMVADFNCRYAKFKAVLESDDVTHNISVSELSVAARILA